MSSAPNEDRTLDCGNARRGVWLVKVPKYIAARWEKANAMTEVGRLKITNSRGVGGKPEILFNLSEELVKSSSDKSEAPDPNANVKIPTEHRFAISDIKDQALAVFSQNTEDPTNLSIEGNVVQKGECRPSGDGIYMSLKKQTIKTASQPKKVVQQLDRAVNNYKPVAIHRVDLENEQKRKAEGKKSRDDKEKVQNMLFAAFEKHQYYNIKDLEKITRQPIPYLKEILKEICHYNAKNPHKNMWELKPEFRHYKEDK